MGGGGGSRAGSAVCAAAASSWVGLQLSEAEARPSCCRPPGRDFLLRGLFERRVMTAAVLCAGACGGRAVCSL